MRNTLRMTLALCCSVFLCGMTPEEKLRETQCAAVNVRMPAHLQDDRDRALTKLTESKHRTTKLYFGVELVIKYQWAPYLLKRAAQQRAVIPDYPFTDKAIVRAFDDMSDDFKRRVDGGENPFTAFVAAQEQKTLVDFAAFTESTLKKLDCKRN